MNLEKEDYLDPRCPLSGKPDQDEPPRPVPIDRIMAKLREYENRNDWPAVGKHLDYWLSEAEMNRDDRGALMLHNELMGFWRKQGGREQALAHAWQADGLIRKLGIDAVLFLNMMTTILHHGGNGSGFWPIIGVAAGFALAVLYGMKNRGNEQ